MAVNVLWLMLLGRLALPHKARLLERVERLDEAELVELAWFRVRVRVRVVRVRVSGQWSVVRVRVGFRLGFGFGVG